MDSWAKGVHLLVKRWSISWITGQNVQKLLIFSIFASYRSSIVKGKESCPCWIKSKIIVLTFLLGSEFLVLPTLHLFFGIGLVVFFLVCVVTGLFPIYRNAKPEIHCLNVLKLETFKVCHKMFKLWQLFSSTTGPIDTKIGMVILYWHGNTLLYRLV